MIKTIAFPIGLNVVIISICFGDAVFPIITIIAIIILGINAYRKRQTDKIVNPMNADSNIIAFVKN